jgi:hypothetical protein
MSRPLKAVTGCVARRRKQPCRGKAALPQVSAYSGVQVMKSGANQSRLADADRPNDLSMASAQQNTGKGWCRAKFLGNAVKFEHTHPDIVLD